MTSTRPTRATVAGRVYLDLQNLARRQGRPAGELHQLHALEGFLARLAASPYADRFVLKGGVLLAAYAARRPTRDVDVLARGIANETHDVLRLVRDIASTTVDDGLVFETDAACASIIRDGDVYSGVRVSLTARLGRARLAMHVDVNVGDPVSPPPRLIEVPRLHGPALHVMGYPLSMVHAEKIVTAVERGEHNTRWRDFADVHLLAARHAIDGRELQDAVTTVATHRSVARAPLSHVLDGWSASAQERWSAWRRKQALEDRVPEAFAEVLDEVVAFADPALAGSVDGRRWDPVGRAWC